MPSPGTFTLVQTKTGYTLRKVKAAGSRVKKAVKRGGRDFKVSIALQGKVKGGAWVLKSTSHKKALDQAISRLKKKRGLRKLPKGDAITTDFSKTGAKAQQFWDVGSK